jgi:hypothetical protein
MRTIAGNRTRANTSPNVKPAVVLDYEEDKEDEHRMNAGRKR